MQLQSRFKTKFNVKNYFKKSFTKSLNNLSKMGKALLFPIAVLPIAGILNRIGAQLPGDEPWAFFIKSLFSMAGAAVFNNLPILFAIGVAFGLTKDNRGEAALVGFLGMIIVTLLLGPTWDGKADLPGQIYHSLQLFPPPTSEQLASPAFTKDREYVGFARLFGDRYNDVMANNVLNGIIVGVLISQLYNRFNGIELPKVLGFFSGRRLIPVIGILAVLVFTILWAIIFPWIAYVLFRFSEVLLSATGNRYANAGIAGVYGFLNRLLLAVGLHNVPNTLFWFVFGQFDAGTGFAFGDINGFLSGNVIQNNGTILTAGTFQTGFFPMMMFGLPGLCYAFYRNAENQQQRNRVLSLFGPAALVSFLTGITEPIEYAFAFISPLLYILHAILTGIFAFITNLFGMQIGFNFSAGFLDYLLSIPKSVQIADAKGAISSVQGVFANPGWIFVVGPVCGLTYYFVANVLIKKLNIATPGRGANQIFNDEFKKTENIANGGLSTKAKKIVLGLGGWDNINDYQNCTTRLRYGINDYSKVNEDLIKKSGVVGLKKISDNSVQIIVGPSVEILNDEIINHKNAPLDLTDDTTKTAKPLDNQQQPIVEKEPVTINSPIGGKVISLDELSDKTFSLIGKGIAIVPNNEEFKILNDHVTLENGFNTGHAYILKIDNYYIMVHIGIDTVELKNENNVFDSKYINQHNVAINKNDILVKVNLEAIKKANYQTVTPIIVMNESLSSNNVVELLVKDGQTISQGQPLFVIKNN